MGVPRPAMLDPPVLRRSCDIESFVLEVEETERPGQKPTMERREALMDMTAQRIKNLSRTRMRFEGIVEWVIENFPSTEQMDRFVHDVPVAILELISIGVNHYATELRGEEEAMEPSGELPLNIDQKDN
jgi:hypothetical protein